MRLEDGIIERGDAVERCGEFGVGDDALVCERRELVVKGVSTSVVVGVSRA